MKAMQPRNPVSLCLLALPETTPASLHGLFEVFNSVGVTWSKLTGESAQTRQMSARIVARRKRSFVSPTGIPITPQAALVDLDPPDIVVG